MAEYRQNDITNYEGEAEQAQEVKKDRQYIFYSRYSNQKTL